jgi:hypothetical protein
MRLTILCSTALVACGGGTVQTNTHGSATYAKPASEGGKQVAPQQKSDDLKVTITLTGAGTFDKAAGAACALTSGDYSETVTTTGTVSDGGNYVSNYGSAQSSGSFTNPVCGAVSNVKTSSVASLTIEASLPTSDTNCSDYCTANAQVQCKNSSDVNCVANATATCKSDCKTHSSISGHGEISANALTSVNSKVSGSGTVDAQVDLVFNSVH